MTRRGCLAAAFLFGLMSGGASFAQTGPSTKIAEAVEAFAADPRLANLDDAARRRFVEFVIGNTLFTLTHELGHAVIQVFQLPVLGLEEDAADTFATLALLHIGSEFSRGALLDAARGLMRVAQKDQMLGVKPVFFDAHGLDQQRAYQIVCLMVGSNPEEFRQVAERAGLPADRREECVYDFEQAEDAWVRLLKPHFRRAAGKPSFLERLLRIRPRSEDRQPVVAIMYGDAPPTLTSTRDALMRVGLLEAVRDFATETFRFRERIVLEAKACGGPNAYWDGQERRLVLCYELVGDYAELALRQP
jgi:hypothetical protein